MTHEKSLIKLYTEKVFDTVLLNRKHSLLPGATSSKADDMEAEIAKGKIKPAFMFNTGGARFDIFKGPFTRDDQFTVIPFDNEIWAVESGLDYDLVLAVVEWLNSLWGEPELVQSILKENFFKMGAEIADGDKQEKERTIQWMQRNEVVLIDALALHAQRQEAAADYTAYLLEEEAFGTSGENSDDDGLLEKLKQEKKKPNPTFGYVTKDKCGPHGDDIRHRPLPAYPLPEFLLSTRASAPSDSTSLTVQLVFYVSLHILCDTDNLTEWTTEMLPSWPLRRNSSHLWC